MPYVELKGEDTCIWYITNLKDNDVANLDSAKPTVLLLHDCVTDSSFLDLQFNDPRLERAFNMIAFDSRSTGLTINPLDPSRDTWTEAADFIKAMLTLELPPSHIFACGLVGQQVALHMASLWPERCLSLALVGPRPNSKEPEWAAEAYREILRTVLEADGIEDMEDVARELIYYLFDERMSEDRQDKFATYLATQYTGKRTPRFYDYHMILLDRESLNPDEIDMIHQPVLILQCRDSVVYDGEVDPDSNVLYEHIVRASGKVEKHLVDGPTQVYGVPPFAQQVNDLYLNFLNSTASTLHLQSWTPQPIQAYLAEGLSRLAGLLHRADLRDRDPLRSSSFSLVSSQMIEERSEILESLERGAAYRSTTGILGSNGLPIRKFSERHNQIHTQTPLSPFGSEIISVTSYEIVEA